MSTTITPRAEILSLFENGPTLLEDALSGLSDADLDWSLADGTWSIRQIVHHLADGDDVWKICIKAALGSNASEFTLQWYWDQPQAQWAEAWKYASRDITPSLTLLHASRRHIMDLIRHIPDCWERSIRIKWPDRETRATVGWILEMQARHVAGHIQDIKDIAAAHQSRRI